jgi:hypothetical protein
MTLEKHNFVFAKRELEQIVPSMTLETILFINQRAYRFLSVAIKRENHPARHDISTMQNG